MSQSTGDRTRQPYTTSTVLKLMTETQTMALPLNCTLENRCYCDLGDRHCHSLASLSTHLAFQLGLEDAKEHFCFCHPSTIFLGSEVLLQIHVLKCTPVGRLLFSSPLTGISEKCIEDGVYTCYITRRASGSCTGDVRVMNETLLWSVATSSEWGRSGGLDGVDRGSSRSVVGGSRFSDALSMNRDNQPYSDPAWGTAVM